MSGFHTVEQGEHLSQLAKQYGFSDYLIIWNDPQNADLKQKRQNPNVLFPGDRIYIRDKEQRQEQRATDKRHPFKAKRHGLKLRLIVEDQYEKPIANAPCVLAIDSNSKHITTDGDGKIEEDIPLDAKKAMLMIQDPQTPHRSIEIPIAIGNLDPAEEFSGQWGRLANMGYIDGPPDETRTDDFASAVEEFQCDNSLKVDGDCGPATQAKLKKVHGC